MLKNKHMVNKCRARWWLQPIWKIIVQRGNLHVFLWLKFGEHMKTYENYHCSNGTYRTLFEHGPFSVEHLGIHVKQVF